MSASYARISEKGTCSKSTCCSGNQQLMSSFQNYAKLEAHFKWVPPAERLIKADHSAAITLHAEMKHAWSRSLSCLARSSTCVLIRLKL